MPIDLEIIEESYSLPEPGRLRSGKNEESWRFIDLVIFKAYNMSMKVTNIADFKNHLSKLLSLDEKSEETEARKRNAAIARVVPIFQPRKVLEDAFMGKQANMMLLLDAHAVAREGR